MPNYWFDLLIRGCHGCTNYGINFSKGNLLYKRFGFNLRHISKHSMDVFAKTYYDSDKKIKRTTHVFTTMKEDFHYGSKAKKEELKFRYILGIVGVNRGKRYLLGLPCRGQHTQTNGTNAEIHRYNLIGIKTVKKLTASDLKRQKNSSFRKDDYLKFLDKLTAEPKKVIIKRQKRRCIKKERK